jgi:hypothetical protein
VQEHTQNTPEPCFIQVTSILTPHHSSQPTCRKSSSCPAAAKLTAMRLPPALLRLPSTEERRRRYVS